jgi:glycolate oxidase
MRLPENIEISSAPEDLVCYGFDASGISGRPAYVAWPRSTEETARLAAWCSAHSLALAARGAGTGMTAGAVPLAGAVVASFEKMDRIIEVDEGNLTALVEPGVVNGALQRELRPRGLFYPPDPASLEFCTIGGNVAENAGGPRALKYGVTRDYVMEIEAVLASGEVIRTGVATHKGVVGYDLTRLLVGSEGTLALMTRIRLKVIPEAGAVATLLSSFPSVEAAGEAVARITAARIVPRTCEFMDRGSVRAVEAYRPAGLPQEAEALLLVELDGHPADVEAQAARVGDIMAALGGGVERARTEADRERLWETRRAISPALHNLGMRKINEDVVVPRPALPAILRSLGELSARSGIMIVNFGHAGDGNIHVNIMAPEGDPEALARAHALVPEVFALVLGAGGTISGEHGVGLTKAPYIGMEIGKRELALMREIKRAFDPRGIMNPGKIFG